MFSFFQKKSKPTPILVSKDALESNDSYDLVHEVAAFWERYFYEEFVRPEDLPDGVFDVSCALNYYGRVLNGGHAQCLDNMDYETSEFDNIARVLRDSGNEPMLSIFQEFRSLSGPTPSKALFDDKTILKEFNALDLQAYDLQKGEFDFYLRTHNWIRDVLGVVVKPSEEIERFQKNLPASLPGFDDFKMGKYLAPYIHSLRENDHGLFQAAASGMRVNKKPVLITRVTEVPRPEGARADVVRFFNLNTSIGKMQGIQTREQYAICQRTGTAPGFGETLPAGTGGISDLRKLIQHAQRHDPVLIAHLFLDKGDALSGLKHITFYFPNCSGPQPQYDSMSYLVETRKGQFFRMDVSDLGSGLCIEGEFDVAQDSLRGSALKRQLAGLRKQLQVYSSRQPTR